MQKKHITFNPKGDHMNWSATYRSYRARALQLPVGQPEQLEKVLRVTEWFKERATFENAVRVDDVTRDWLETFVIKQRIFPNRKLHI